MSREAVGNVQISLSLWQKIILKLNFLKSKEPPHDEYVLGFIRLDSGLLNNKLSLTNVSWTNKTRTRFRERHIVTGKMLVPTQPFGRLFRGKVNSITCLFK